jgi:type VI protein secretion system component Hcp
VGFAATGWSLTGTNSTKFALKITPGKTSLGDLVVTRPMDVCSEQVLKAFVAGTNYPTLTLTQYSIYGTAKKAYAAMVVTLTTAFVNDYSLSGSTGNKTIETVSYAYQKVCFATTALTSAGVPGTKTTVCYDVATGKESGS